MGGLAVCVDGSILGGAAVASKNTNPSDRLFGLSKIPEKFVDRDAARVGRVKRSAGMKAAFRCSFVRFVEPSQELVDIGGAPHFHGYENRIKAALRAEKAFASLFIPRFQSTALALKAWLPGFEKIRY